MRICHIVSSLGIGGAEAFVVDLACAQAAAGHRVLVVSLSEPAALGDASAVGPDNHARLAEVGVEHRMIGHRARRRILPGARLARRYLDDFQPDIAHAHLISGVLLAILGRWRGQLVVTHHSTPMPLPAWAMRLLARRAQGFIGISTPGIEAIRGIYQGPVTQIPNGINLARISPLTRSKRPEHAPVNVLSLGNLRAAKNYPHLVEIAAKLPELCFEIAGEGDQRPLIEAAIARHGVAGRVKLLGARSDVPDLLAGADIYLLTSSYEGMPIALIEAMRAGLPIVASDVGGCAEMLAGSGARLAAPDDTEAFVRHLTELSRDPGLRAEIAEQARMRAEDFAIETSAERYLAFYDEVCR